MKYLGEQWQCECGEINGSQPWECPGCGKEVCEGCLWEFMHCRTCSEADPDKDKLRLAAEAKYQIEWDSVNEA